MNGSPLNQLLAENKNANEFFNALPYEAQTYIRYCHAEITQEDALYRTANRYFQQIRPEH